MDATVKSDDNIKQILVTSKRKWDGFNSLTSLFLDMNFGHRTCMDVLICRKILFVVHEM